jgi:hypothetical protein
MGQESARTDLEQIAVVQLGKVSACMRRIIMRREDLADAIVTTRNLRACQGNIADAAAATDGVFMEIVRGPYIALKVAILATGAMIVFDPQGDARVWTFRKDESDKCVQHVNKLMGVPSISVARPG